jgi:hypothetical protein
MNGRCDNCGKELSSQFKLDQLELCVECGYRIQAAKAEQDYWENRKRELVPQNLMVSPSKPDYDQLFNNAVGRGLVVGLITVY